MSALIKWTPAFEPMREFEKIFSDIEPGFFRREEGFVPAVDVYEDKENVIAEAQLAGIDPDKVEVFIENDVLCIKGESEKKSEVEDKNYYRKEIRRGSFYRTIALPAPVDKNSVTAESADGVLRISMPKSKRSEIKRIEIKKK